MRHPEPKENVDEEQPLGTTSVANDTVDSSNPCENRSSNKGNADLTADFHERTVQECGTGRFHWLLLLGCGMGLAADTAELLVLGFVLPSAEVDLCISQMEKRILGVATYTGLASGALLWGSMADRVGRRRTLLTALTVAAVFDLMAALMPTFGTFLTARFLGGFGMGGSVPVLIAYYSEFLPRGKRVWGLCALLACWAAGGIYVALMAWTIMPKTGLLVVLDGQQHFSAWHAFLIVCAIPTALAIIGLLSLPESPRILLEIGHEREALVIYKKVYRHNNPKSPEAQFKEADIPALSQETEEGNKSPRKKSIFSVISYTLANFGSSFAELFAAKRRRSTITLMLSWVGASFGFYGLSLWFPEYVKLLKAQEYERRAVTISNVTYLGVEFNESLENINFFHVPFVNVQFERMILNHVTFSFCTFENVSFHKVKSSRTLFQNCTIQRSSFVDTDFFDHRFSQCEMIDNRFVSTDSLCPIDFDFNIHLGEVFVEHLVGEVALIPGLIIAALLMDRIGRVRLAAISLLTCSLLSLALIGIQTHEAVIGFEAAFNAMFAVGFASLTVITTELYPTALRTNGWGLITTLSRGAGLGGLFAYAYMLDTTVLVSSLVTSSAMLLSAAASIFLQETHGALL